MRPRAWKVGMVSWGENSASRGVIAWMHEAPGSTGGAGRAGPSGALPRAWMTRSKSREWFSGVTISTTSSRLEHSHST